jgi:hypothetical protein
VLELPFIARAFPNVPWMFVFREPRAVLRSQLESLGAEALLGTVDTAYLGLEFAAAHAMPSDAYAARVVGAFCAAALRYAETGRSAFVEYAAMPDAVFSDVLPFFGVRAGDAEAARMRDAARLDTKDAGAAFRARADGAGSPDAVDRLAAAWLDAPYAALRAAALR